MGASGESERTSSLGRQSIKSLSLLSKQLFEEWIARRKGMRFAQYEGIIGSYFCAMERLIMKNKGTSTDLVDEAFFLSVA